MRHTQNPLPLLLSLFVAVPAIAAPVAVENANLEKGTTDGWKLSGGTGQLVAEAKNHALAVSGSGTDSNYWRTGALDFRAGQTYRLRFRARGFAASGGTPTSGPSFANRDLGGLGEDWRTFTTYFTAPGDISPENAWLRFGQWQVKGQVAFDDVNVMPAQPVYVHSDAIELGEGESISGNAYACRAPLGGERGNTSRALLTHNSNFNSDRWVFGADSSVIYKHQIAGRQQTAAQIEVGVTWYSKGQLALEASRDGQNWVPLGTQDKIGTLVARVPPALLPADAIYIRLRAEAKAKVGANSDPGSFQVGSYRFQSTFDGAPLNLAGNTLFFAVDKESPELRVKITQAGNGSLSGTLNLQIERDRGGPTGIWSHFTFQPRQPVTPSRSFLTYNGPDGSTRSDLRLGVNSVKVSPIWAIIYLAYASEDLPTTGDFDGDLKLWTGSGPTQKVLFHATASWHVPDLYASNYGEKLPASSTKNGLWWCSSGWKISQTRPAPGKAGTALKIAAARNESEAAQFVLHPTNGLKNLTVESPKLVGANGTTIEAKNVEVLRVRYVDVAQPTDSTGVAAPWPDPLPPLKAPINLTANTNQPFWVRIRVPADAKPGLYKGDIRLKADGYAATVPVQLTVWNFALPNRLTCETAFGFSPSTVYRYQNITDPAQKRQVIDLYLQNYAAHHISPYDPAPLDPFKVAWQGGSVWQGGLRSTENPHGGKQALLVDDNSKTAQVAARLDKVLSIPQRGLKLSFWYRTRTPDQPFIVTFAHQDAADQWMPGRNNDMKITGDGSWQHFEKTVTQFPDGAKKVGLNLWATLWQDDGTPTGAVFYDDISLVDLDTGKELLTDGDFEDTQNAVPRPVFDWTAWDAAMGKAIDHYGFNSFRLPLQGLGSGTFESRDEPELIGFRENTPEYQAALKAYLQGIEAHLKEKGWLDEAYVYWFDEPDPKDYAFVMNGFAKLKNYAPGLRRMLTEQPEPGLFGGPNLWCPVSSEFKQPIANERMDAGDNFWWYVCTAPKAPYATEFIDHPGTEMRVWLWQTWQRGIGGVLVWETNYWTSGAAYPNEPQNPYADPMSWVSGYSTAHGQKSPWGNGDGRFIYPPEAAAEGKPGAPLIAGPVDSIRWELLRDGLEDYEYLIILHRLLDKKPVPIARWSALRQLLIVPESITKDATTFTRDPAPIEARRAELAAAIEELSVH